MAEGVGFTKEVHTILRPSSFGTVRAWYKASLESFADGDLVGTFSDQSGNGRHLTQATSGNKPTFKLNAANGKAALLFSTNDYMQTASFASAPQPLTIFLVVKRVVSGSNQYILDALSAGWNIYQTGSTGKVQIYAGGSSVEDFDDMGSDWVVLQGVFNGASSKLYRNELPVASGNAGSTGVTGFTLGASVAPSDYFNGYVAEMIVFDGTLTTDQSYTITRSLMAEYKIDYFDPSSGFSLVSKFMGDGIRLRDGEAVSTWADPISGFDLVQATASKQPLLVRDEQNHRSVVRFDGSNDFLRSVAFSALSQPRTIYAVAKNTSNAAIRTLLDGIASGNRHTINYQTSGNLLIYAGSSLNSGVNAGLGWNIVTAQFNGGSSIIRRNGAQENTGAVGSNTLTGFTVGALYDDSLPFTGDVAAILVCSGAHTTLQMKQIESFLKGWYGL